MIIPPPGWPGALTLSTTVASPLRRLARQPDRARLHARAGKPLRRRDLPRRHPRGRAAPSSRSTATAPPARSKVAAKQRPEITGTLAFAQLDLTPYFAGLSRSFRTAENWRDIRLDTDWFGDIAADVRLSADSVAAWRLSLRRRRRRALSLRDARLEIGHRPRRRQWRQSSPAIWRSSIPATGRMRPSRRSSAPPTPALRSSRRFSACRRGSPALPRP